MFFPFPRGPRPFAPIFSSPLRSEIDERLFERRHRVARVHQWLAEASAVPISYAMLSRYKKWVAKERPSLDEDVRVREVGKDLAYLDRVIRLGQDTLDSGLCVRPSEALRAVELRANILERFPDLSGDREKQYQAALQTFADTVMRVVSPEQLNEIRAIFDLMFGPDPE